LVREKKLAVNAVSAIRPDTTGVFIMGSKPCCGQNSG